MKTFYKKELKTVMAIFALAFGLLLTNTAQAQTTIVLGNVDACDSWTAPWDLTGATVLTTSTTTSGTNVALDTTWTVTLTVLASSSSSHTVDACDSWTVPSGDTTFTASTTYTDVITNVAGCDSTINLTVNISTGTNTGTPVTVTECDSYLTPGGVLLTASTAIIDVTTGSNGCPENTTINFVLAGNSNFGGATIVACGDYTGASGTVYDSSGTYLDTTSQVVSGCDSIITLNLTINNGDENNTLAPQNISSCNTYTSAGGVTVTSDTSFVDVVFTAGGAANECDLYESTTLNITITAVANLAGTLDTTMCGSYTDPLGSVLTSDSTGHAIILTSVGGCDSTVTIDYTNAANSETLALIESCGSWVNPNGDTVAVSTAGHTYSLTDANGCQTDYTIDINVNAGVNDTVFSSPLGVCDSYTDPLDPNGTVYTTVGPHTYTRIAAAGSIAPGCDEIVVLTLTIAGNDNSGSSSVTACNSYTWGAHPSVSVDTILETTYTNASGCDSVHTLTVDISVEPSHQFMTVSPCQPYMLQDSSFITVSGAYNDVFVAANGCDSVVTLTVNVVAGGNTTGVAPNVYGCTSATHGGVTFTNDTTVYETLVAANGCDSVVSTSIMLNSATSTGTASITECNSYTAGDGTVYTASGTFTDLATNMYGCDSTVLVTLTITNSQNTIDVVECGSEYYTPSGDTLTTAGMHMDTIAGLMGCDSIITINLSFGAESNTEDDHSCTGTYNWNGTTYTADGTYTWTGTNASGCDSVEILNLTFGDDSPVQTVQVTSEGPWTDYDGNIQENSGVYNYSYTNASGCDSTITVALTVNDIVNGVNETLSNVNVYPNPTNGNVTIELGDLTNVSVKVTNLIGEVIYEDHKISNSTYNLYIEEAAGLYFVEISNENNKEVIKLLVE